MDKLEEISAPRKEREAPAAETGDVVATEASVADTRGKLASARLPKPGRERQQRLM
jgi:hypothetical protein